MTDRIKLYSAREQKKRQADTPPDLQYDDFSDEFRVKVAHAIRAAIPWQSGSLGMVTGESVIWREIEALLESRHGKVDLSPSDYIPPEKWQSYFRSLRDPERVLDCIEAPLRVAMRRMLHYGSKQSRDQSDKILGRAVNRLNDVFGEHDLGYKFVPFIDDGFADGEIIRSDSEFLHQEAVEPAIGVLHGVGYEGPLEEFLEAHREHRRGKHKSAVNEALKAFESTMKCICRDRGIKDYDQATASKLIKLLVDNNVIPKENDSFFAGVRTVLESGVPTIRNRQGAHGQGPDIVEMRDYSATFALNIAASAILYLVSIQHDSAADAKSGVVTKPQLDPRLP